MQPKHYPDYSVSSGFTLDSLDARDPQVIENLGVTCRVWGYVKYHHPVFADSTLNVDYELSGSCRKSPKPPRPNATKSFPNG